MRRRGTSWLFAALGREQNGLIDSLCIERTRRQEALFQGLPSPSLSILQTNERTDKRVREDRPTNHLFHPGCPSPTGCKHARRTCCRCEGLTHQPTNPVAEGGRDEGREASAGIHGAMRTIRQRLRRSQVRRSGDSDSISSRQQLKVNATPEDTSLPPDPRATPITNELRRRRMKLASLLYLEKWRLSHGVCEGGRSHGRNGVTLTTFPSSPLSRCHSSEKEGRVPSKYEPTSETPLRHAPRGICSPPQTKNSS